MSLTALSLIILAYMVGSLSFAVLVSRGLGIRDPRHYGSHNPGATNVLRSGHKTAAVLTLLGDSAKGFVMVYLTKVLVPDYGVSVATVACVACAVMMGHMWPLFFRFKGGKGVATALGVMCAFNLFLGMWVIITWGAVAWVTRYSSLAALISLGLAPFYGFFFFPASQPLLGAIWVIALLIFYRHRINLVRLLTHQEEKIGERAGDRGQRTEDR